MFFQTKNFLTRIIKILKIQTPFMAIIIILIIRVMTERLLTKPLLWLAWFSSTIRLPSYTPMAGEVAKRLTINKLVTKRQNLAFQPPLLFPFAEVFTAQRLCDCGVKASPLRRRGLAPTAQTQSHYAAIAPQAKRARPAQPPPTPPPAAFPSLKRHFPRPRFLVKFPYNHKKVCQSHCKVQFLFITLQQSKNEEQSRRKGGRNGLPPRHE